MKKEIEKGIEYIDKTEDYDEEMMFICNGCRKKKRIEGMLFDGLGGRFCSKDCMKKGNKSLEDF